MKWRAPLAGILVAASVAGVCAAGWPGYMGPRRDGTSTEKGLLRTWPKQGPKVLWTVPLGAGFAGPAVSRGKVYILDRDDKVGDLLRVYDVATGKERWTFAYDAPGKFEFNGSHTQPPILYKDHFYVQYTTNERSDGLVCMTLDGQVNWKTGEEPLFSKGGARRRAAAGDRRQHEAVFDRA